MILHKECLPIERKWLDKPYCYPFTFPWEIILTSHFGCEHLSDSYFSIDIELIDSYGLIIDNITSTFRVSIGQDFEGKNMFVAQLKEFPNSMPTNFQLRVTIKHDSDIIFSQITEPYLFVNDQCFSAYFVSNSDWIRISNNGSLMINSEPYSVGITGSNLMAGITFGINDIRKETNLGIDTGLVYDLYGKDQDGNSISFQYAGTVCNKGTCHIDTLLIEGMFDCMAPDGRYVGSVFPIDGFDEDVRYRYFTRVYADLIEMPSVITRTISLNNKVQRTEKLRKYQLISYEPLTDWQKEEVETILLGARILIQGEEYIYTTGTAFERVGVPGTTGWWLKADFEKLVERKEYSCEVVCLTCLKPTGLSFSILPQPCDPLVGVQATSSLNDDGTIKLTISGSNTSGAFSFNIGYRVKGSDSYIYLSPNPSILPAVINGLPNEVYEVIVTKIAEETCPPIEVSSNSTNLSPFDFLVVRYMWDGTAGSDLDTFTGFIDTGTSYDGDWIGYGQGDAKVPAGSADSSAYLFWASDNTQSGVEAVLMNLKQFTDENSGIGNEIKVKMNAVWWGTRLTGNVSIQLTTYLGGTISKDGFDFKNDGGTLVDQVTLQTNVIRESTSANISDSSDVAIVRYNKLTKGASIELV